MHNFRYHSILVRHAIPSGIKLMGKGFVFQQDNDPKHTSLLCRNYLESKERQGVLRMMKWPSQSPDLNPIEAFWDYIDSMLPKSEKHNEKAMWKKLHDTWQSISVDMCKKYIESMVKRVRCVYEAKGGHTKY